MSSESTSSIPPSDLGTHCSLSSCNALDFLPIKCTYCSTSFCRHHSPPSSHACSKDPSLNSRIPSTTSTRTGPELSELLPDTKRNKLSTGVHAQKEEEGSGSGKPQLTKQQLALASLKRSIDAKKGTSPSSGGGPEKEKEKKVNPTIELMRLKQKATSADARKKEGDVAMGERWYLTVKLVEKGMEKKEAGTKQVWVHKSVSAGKALDLFADLFKVSNVNHLANTEPEKRLTLTLPSAPTMPLDLSSRIDSLVPNGGIVLLCRGLVAS
ncbi:AN1-type zinc finger protein [Sporobolomyces salmoneus]|uniref:AN1-type zinc finger protein n=1 Tax=Sporobolomyces salmoneus TaxID=183962 RepID=UPI00317F0F5C